MNKVISLLAIISFVAMSACDSGGSGGNDSNGGGGGNIGPASENLTDDQIRRAGDLNRSVEKSSNQVKQVKPGSQNANTLRTAARAPGPQISEQNCRIQLKSPLMNYDSQSNEMPEPRIPSDPMEALNGETRYEISGANCPIYSLQVQNMTARQDDANGKMTMSGTLLQEMRNNAAKSSANAGFSDMKVTGKISSSGDRSGTISQSEMSGHFSSEVEGKVLVWAKVDMTETRNASQQSTTTEKGHYKQAFKDFTLELFAEQKREGNRIVSEKYVLNGKEITRTEYETLMGDRDRAASNDGFGDNPNGPQNPDQEGSNDRIGDIPNNSGEGKHSPVTCMLLDNGIPMVTLCSEMKQHHLLRKIYDTKEYTLEITPTEAPKFQLMASVKDTQNTGNTTIGYAVTRWHSSNRTTTGQIDGSYYTYRCVPVPRCND